MSVEDLRQATLALQQANKNIDAQAALIDELRHERQEMRAKLRDLQAELNVADQCIDSYKHMVSILVPKAFRGSGIGFRYEVLTDTELTQLRQEIAELGQERPGYESVISAQMAARMLATIDALQEALDSVWRQFEHMQ